MTNVWNNVTIYGPSAELERLRRECLAPDEDVYRAGQSGWDGCNCTISAPPSQDAGSGSRSTGRHDEQVWNFQQFTPDAGVEYSFSFDTHGGFPVRLFEQLAAGFPRLAFDCACIEAQDEFMGFGWFNAPPGGEEFSEDYRVPKDYWTGGGGQRRTQAAQTAHETRVEKLIDEAIRNDGTR